MSACDSNDRIVNNYTDSYYIFLTRESSPEKLSIMEIPSGSIISDDIYREKNGESLPGRIEKISEYGGRFYLLIPEKNSLVIIDKITYAKDTILDFSEEGLEPYDICFPNSTDAYIAFGNSNKVYLLDITTDVISRKIEVGQHPVAIDYAGTTEANFVYTANQGDNTVTIIRTGDHKIMGTLQVGTAPTFIETSWDAKKILVLSIGDGRINENAKTPVKLTKIDAVTRQVTETDEVGNAIVKTNEILPIGFTLTPENMAYILVDSYLIRLYVNFKSPIQILTRDSYQSSLYYNFKRDELETILISGDKKQFVALNASNVSRKTTTLLPEDVYKVFPDVLIEKNN